jgi:hypothetical protein
MFLIPEFKTHVSFFRRMLVDSHYILVGKFHFDYMCLLFSLLVLSVFFYCISSFECYFHVCVLEYICDCSHIKAIICEGGTF